MNDSPLNEMKETNQKMKYVIISGGVVSGLGKGITASSIGLLLKGAGLRVTSIKIDPYLNIDAGIQLNDNAHYQQTKQCMESLRISAFNEC